MTNNRPNEQLSVMDILGVVSFVLGLANYTENLSQTQFQDELNKAVTDIHRHLQIQDDKIDLILATLSSGKGGTAT